MRSSLHITYVGHATCLVEMDGVRFGTRLDIPQVGEHSREVLEQLGYGAAAIAKLAADKAILAR